MRGWAVGKKLGSGIVEQKRCLEEGRQSQRIGVCRNQADKQKTTASKWANTPYERGIVNHTLPNNGQD